MAQQGPLSRWRQVHTAVQNTVQEQDQADAQSWKKLAHLPRRPSLFQDTLGGNLAKLKKLCAADPTCRDTQRLVQLLNVVCPELISELTAESAEKIALSMSVLTLNKGDLVVEQGDEADSFFFLVAGNCTVHIRRPPDNSTAGSSNNSRLARTTQCPEGEDDADMIGGENPQLHAILGPEVGVMRSPYSFGELGESFIYPFIDNRSIAS